MTRGSTPGMGTACAREELVRRCCEVLAPGGYALLHAPYYIDGHVLKDFPDVMQMNFVPQAHVAQRIAESGAVLVHVLDEGVDYCGGNILNCVYVISKPDPPGCEDERQSALGAAPAAPSQQMDVQ